MAAEQLTARLVRDLAAEVIALTERNAEADELIESRFRAHKHAEVILSLARNRAAAGRGVPATDGDIAQFGTPDRLAGFAGPARPGATPIESAGTCAGRAATTEDCNASSTPQR